MIRQFDVFRNPSRRGLEERPYVVAVQSPLWDDMASRICVPLIDPRFIRPQGRVNPKVNVEGRNVYLHPLEMLNVPTRLLRTSVANLESYRFQIVGALDLVFLGI